MILQRGEAASIEELQQVQVNTLRINKQFLKILQRDRIQTNQMKNVRSKYVITTTNFTVF